MDFLKDDFEGISLIVWTHHSYFYLPSFWEHPIKEIKNPKVKSFSLS